MSDRKGVKGCSWGGGGGGDERDRKNLVSLAAALYFIYFFACPLACGLITGSWEGLTHHDDSPGLLCCAHAHDGRHADGGSLEVDAAAEERAGDRWL